MLLVHADGGEAEGQILGVLVAEGGREDLPEIDHASGSMQEDQHLPVPGAGRCHQVGAESHQNRHILIPISY